MTMSHAEVLPDWPAPPFDPETCRGEACYTPSFDSESLAPMGPECGKVATHVVFWKDRRFSPSCGAHGLRVLDADTLDLVLCVHPIEPAITVAVEAP